MNSPQQKQPIPTMYIIQEEYTRVSPRGKLLVSETIWDAKVVRGVKQEGLKLVWK